MDLRNHINERSIHTKDYRVRIKTSSKIIIPEEEQTPTTNHPSIHLERKVKESQALLFINQVAVFQRS